MAPRSRADSAGLAHQVWRLLCALAEQNPGEFTAETRDDAAGWLWEGPGAALMRRVAPEVADAERRRARDYLQATKMMVNVQGQSGSALPLWFVRRDWLGGPAGHVHLVPQEPRRPPREEPVQAAVRAEAARENNLSDAVRELVTRAGEVEAECDRWRAAAAELQAENARLRAETGQLRADRDQLAAENIRLTDAARQIRQLLAEMEE